MNCWPVIALSLVCLPSYAQTVSSEDFRVYKAILERDSAIKAKRIIIIQELANSQEADAVNLAIQDNDLSTLNMMAHEFLFDSTSTATIHQYFISSVKVEKFTNTPAWPVFISFLTKQSFERMFVHDVTRGWKLFY